MSFVDDLKDVWSTEGLRYTLKQGPKYIKREATKHLQGKLYAPYGTIDRDQLTALCKRNGRFWQYGSQTQLTISPPISAEMPDQFQTVTGTHDIPPSFICELSNVRLVGRRALCQTEDGRYILEEMGTKSMLRNSLSNRFDSLSFRQKIRDVTRPLFDDPPNPDYGILINMVPRHGGSHNDFINYGHWILEDLPRLRAYDHYYQKTGRKPRLLLKNNPPSWVTDTLELMGFSSSDWIEWKQNEAIVDRLVIPKLSYIHSIGTEFYPNDRKWVSCQMKEGVDLSQGETYPERVMISRQGQSRRLIRNFDEVMDALSEFGFEAVRPEELSVRDQIKMFHQAKILVGPFGSGLTNIIFANNASVIEIKPYKTEHTVFYIIANENGLPYDYVHGEPTNQEVVEKDSDITVDVGKLINSVKNFI